MRVCEGERGEQGKRMTWHEEPAAPRILPGASVCREYTEGLQLSGGGRKKAEKKVLTSLSCILPIKANVSSTPSSWG